MIFCATVIASSSSALTEADDEEARDSSGEQVLEGRGLATGELTDPVGHDGELAGADAEVGGDPALDLPVLRQAAAGGPGLLDRLVDEGRVDQRGGLGERD